MKTCLFIAFVFISGVLFFPSDALACACCADVGFYSISTKKPENFELEELKKIRFSTANLFLAPASNTALKGINSSGENFSVDGLLSGVAWKLNFKDDKSKTGVLSLSKPTTMVSFMADLYDTEDTGLGVRLYKEWRFKYRLQNATGIFNSGNAPATEYFLVLQGRGNACTQAEDFTHWRLEITGRKADYAFYGKLKPLS